MQLFNFIYFLIIFQMDLSHLLMFILTLVYLYPPLRASLGTTLNPLYTEFWGEVHEVKLCEIVFFHII